MRHYPVTEDYPIPDYRGDCGVACVLRRLKRSFPALFFVKILSKRAVLHYLFSNILVIFMNMRYLTLDKALDAWRKIQPISDDDKARLARRFSVDFNYNSNHIEGNTLTYGQTEILLLFGKVIGEANVRSVQEMVASEVSLKMMEAESRIKESPLTQNFIRGLHRTLLREDYEVHRTLPDGMQIGYTVHAGQYKTRPNSVITHYGDRFEYASPEETPALMTDLVDWYNEAERGKALAYRIGGAIPLPLYSNPPVRRRKRTYCTIAGELYLGKARHSDDCHSESQKNGIPRSPALNRFGCGDCSKRRSKGIDSSHQPFPSVLSQHRCSRSLRGCFIRDQARRKSLVVRWRVYRVPYTELRKNFVHDAKRTRVDAGRHTT